jgi:hypothetical protein
MHKWLRVTGFSLSLVVLFASTYLWVSGYFVSTGVTWAKQVSELKNEQHSVGSLLGAIVIQDFSIDYTITARSPDMVMGWVAPREFFVDQAKVEENVNWKAEPVPGMPWRFKLRQLVRFEATSQTNPAKRQQSPETRTRAIIFPIWPATIISAIMPALTAIHWRQRRTRKRRGLCLKCGYDLREQPQICPECGHATPA